MADKPDSDLQDLLDQLSFGAPKSESSSPGTSARAKTLAVLHLAAERLREEGKLDAAKELQQRVYVGRRQLLGEDHAQTLESLNALILIYEELGEIIGARQLSTVLYQLVNRTLPKVQRRQIRLGSGQEIFVDLALDYPVTLQLPTGQLSHVNALPHGFGSDLLASQAEAALVLHHAGEGRAARRILDSVLDTAPALLGRSRTTLGKRLYPSRRIPDLTTARKLQRALSLDSNEVLGPDLPDAELALGDLAASLRNFGALHPQPALTTASNLKFELLNLEPMLEPLIEEKTEEETPSRDRFANVWISSFGKLERIVNKRHALEPNRKYTLHLTIGKRLPYSAVENPRPFPQDKLPPNPVGHWLEVLVASDEFTLEPKRRHIFLPDTGDAFVCPCVPGGEHTCNSSERRADLAIPVSTPVLEALAKADTQTSFGQSPVAGRNFRRAQLRLAIYFRKNLVQSLLLKARISAGSHADQKFGYSARIDYSLTSGLSDVNFLPVRTLNILTNDSGSGNHRILFNGDQGDPVTFNINEKQIGAAITAARLTLKNTGVKEFGGGLGAKVQYQNLYDAKNGKPKAKFIDDLRVMASLGFTLWATLFQKQPDDQDKISSRLAGFGSKPAVIQVSRVEDTDFMFPWAMIYDIPMESAVQPSLCKCLDAFGTGAAPLDHCPFERDHAKGNVLCPFGFWGFKHIIELPPSMPSSRALPMSITKRNPAGMAQVVMGISQELDSKETTTHTKNLKDQAAFQLVLNDSLTGLKQALAQDQLEFVYLYCHGRRNPLPGSEIGIPQLAVGKDKEGITPPDIIAWRKLSWSKTHWTQTSPLVFINGCHTAELTPELLVNFVDSFVGVYASGVIGTEILLLQTAAGEAAEQILRKLNTRDSKGVYGSVGESVREMRLHFMNKGSLLGLAYTPYCCADLKLAN